MLFIQLQRRNVKIYVPGGKFSFLFPLSALGAMQVIGGKIGDRCDVQGGWGLHERASLTDCFGGDYMPR